MGATENGQMERSERRRPPEETDTFDPSKLTGSAREAYQRLRPHIESRFADAPADDCERDVHGNIIAIPGPGGKARFRYDARQRLVSAKHPGLKQTRYAYDEKGRLTEIRQGSVVKQFHYEEADGGDVHRIYPPIRKIIRGNAGAAVFKYDSHGRTVSARTPGIGLVFDRDTNGDVKRISQTIGGVSVDADFLRTPLPGDAGNVLDAITLSGMPVAVRYEWDCRARPTRVLLGDHELVRYEYPSDSVCVHRFFNGWRETGHREPTGTLPESWHLSQQQGSELSVRYERDDHERIIGDGTRRYTYDENSRLRSVTGSDGAQETTYHYDDAGNLSGIDSSDGNEIFEYGQEGRVARRRLPNGDVEHREGDCFGQTLSIRNRSVSRGFTYDDDGQLITVRDSKGHTVSIESDAYHRTTTLADSADVERYLYGPDDQLLAVYTAEGTLRRAYVYGPNGRALAEIRFDGASYTVFALHLDPMGNCRVVTDDSGAVRCRFRYTPFGNPTREGEPFAPIFQNHRWSAPVNMYDFQSRWYDPVCAAFLTPDTYTGAPDDERLILGSLTQVARAAMRAGLLDQWMKQPATRLRYAFCWNDPLNHLDENGHWPAGAVILNIFGFLWTLPNTLLGIFFEITCLVGEILRWILWLFSGGHSLWEPLGFDAAASDRVHAWALVFRGGWLGSFPNLMGLTFGNVFFVNGEWEADPVLAGPGDVFPEAENGQVPVPRREAFYDHMLAHTWQSLMWGPLFYWIPLPGVYLWSIIFSGKCDSFMERDAIEKAGL